MLIGFVDHVLKRVKKSSSFVAAYSGLTLPIRMPRRVLYWGEAAMTRVSLSMSSYWKTKSQWFSSLEENSIKTCSDEIELHSSWITCLILSSNLGVLRIRWNRSMSYDITLLE